jgi:adenylate kinase family enzyme
VLVGGISGAGKTTFARELCRRTGLPYYEMDGFFHGPGWERIPTFEEDVAAVAAQDRWVFDSHGYKEVRDLVWSRADTVVWLAYSRRVSTSRVLRRSFARAWDKEPMFNGNTENFSAWIDPEHPIQWSLRAYGARREDMLTRFADPAYAHVRKVRLDTPAAAQRWLDLVAPVRG